MGSTSLIVALMMAGSIWSNCGTKKVTALGIAAAELDNRCCGGYQVRDCTCEGSSGFWPCLAVTIMAVELSVPAASSETKKLPISISVLVHGRL